MPMENSKRLMQQSAPTRQDSPPGDASEEIVTPIEAEIQNHVEREFERTPLKKKAIVSVNGHDVADVPVSNHDRAA